MGAWPAGAKRGPGEAPEPQRRRTIGSGPHRVNAESRVLSAINRWRIDPADIAVLAPVNDVESAAGAVHKHHNRGPAQVQFHDRFADGKLPQRLRRLRNDHRIEGVDFLVVEDRLFYEV